MNPNDYDPQRRWTHRVLESIWFEVDARLKERDRVQHEQQRIAAVVIFWASVLLTLALFVCIGYLLIR